MRTICRQKPRERGCPRRSEKKKYNWESIHARTHRDTTGFCGRDLYALGSRLSTAERISPRNLRTCALTCIAHSSSLHRSTAILSSLRERSGAPAASLRSPHLLLRSIVRFEDSVKTAALVMTVEASIFDK